LADSHSEQACPNTGTLYDASTATVDSERSKLCNMVAWQTVWLFGHGENDVEAATGQPCRDRGSQSKSREAS